MDIHEYQAKEILARFGVPVPRGGLAYSPEQAGYRARELGGNAWVVKAQIHSGGRGAAGGVKLARVGAFVPEIIRPLATGMDGAGAVDDIGLAQAPLGARLLVGQDQAQVAIVDQRIGRGRLTQHRQRTGIVGLRPRLRIEARHSFEDVADFREDLDRLERDLPGEGQLPLLGGDVDKHADKNRRK